MRKETSPVCASVVLLIVISCCCYCCIGFLEVERKALLQIKDSINHPNGSALPSWVGKNCSAWSGIKCDPSSSHVITIDLKKRRTSLGTWSPNATLFSLFNHLVEIDLSNNMIEMDGSHMLQAFCELEFLEIINIHHNLLEGVLPACLRNMRSLRVLGLARNNFTGGIPSFFSNLLKIQEIDVGSNSFQGVVSFSIFSNLSNLEILILADNEQLEVETEPMTWVPLFQLTSLYLGNCNLNKHRGNMIPTFLSSQYNLVNLDLSHNSLTGSIHTWMFSNISGMLRLKNNMLSGPFLQDSADFSSVLQVLDISDNNVDGSFPDNFGELFPSLSLVNMSRNCLQGNIPPSIGEITTLELLDLSNNYLTGEIPESLMTNGDSLKFLMLSNNSLEGDLPLRDCKLTQLIVLQLDRNNFTGGIPHCLSNSLDLEYLDVRMNHLSGNLSSSLPVFPKMRALLLGRNPFKDHVPVQLCQMPNLQFLDLSYSSLSGNIPSCLNKITSWKNLSQASNSTTLGVVNSSFKNVNIKVRVEFTTKFIPYRYEGGPLALMTGTDMSSNKLTGNIPIEMGDLKELRALNLSNNILTGPLPVSFQNLKNLESLDLSHNKLNGTIPLGFLQLNTLSTFSVAFNNLSGKIPYSQQFLTFNESSFKGNQYLCGKPLDINCSFDNQPPQYQNEEKGTSKFIDSNLFFYMLVAISYILGFWIVIALLVFNKRWRHNYFKVVDRLINLCSEKLSLCWCCLKK